MTRKFLVPGEPNRAQQQMADAARATQAWLDANEKDFVCDFCAHKIEGEFATYTLDGPIISEVGLLDNVTLEAASMTTIDTSDWAACMSCDPVVAAGDPESLTDWVLAHRDASRVGPIRESIRAVVRADLVELYEAFYGHNPRRLGVQTR